VFAMHATVSTHDAVPPELPEPPELVCVEPADPVEPPDPITGACSPIGTSAFPHADAAPRMQSPASTMVRGCAKDVGEEFIRRLLVSLSFSWCPGPCVFVNQSRDGDRLHASRTRSASGEAA